MSDDALVGQTGLQEVFDLLATGPRRDRIGAIKEAVMAVAIRTAEDWNTFRASDVGQKVAAVVEDAEHRQLERLNSRLAHAWHDLQEALRVAESAPFVDGSAEITKAFDEWKTLLADARWIREMLTQRATTGIDNRNVLRHYVEPGATAEVVAERDGQGRIVKITRLNRGSRP